MLSLHHLDDDNVILLIDSWWPVAQTNVICKRAHARHKTNGWKKESDFGWLIDEK